MRGDACDPLRLAILARRPRPLGDMSKTPDRSLSGARVEILVQRVSLLEQNKTTPPNPTFVACRTPYTM